MKDETTGSASSVAYEVTIDEEKCIDCGLCEAFCPVNVFALDTVKGPGAVVVSNAEACWGCETCVGQCPQDAIRVAGDSVVDPFLDAEKADPLPTEQLEEYQEWAETLKNILGLRWDPVAISLIKTGDPLPDVPVPTERLRFCQSLMAARRGRSFMMPANRHACPDGTNILGLTEIPEKLASGDLYVLFHKLDSKEAAQQMVKERPSLEPYSTAATVTTPLNQAACPVDVVAVVAEPEQVMWLCMSAAYYTGHRWDFHASGYNAQCVETTLIPYQSGQPNISFGCYGCRASSDVGDNLMFMGIPVSLMPTVVKGLNELSKKAIPQSRAKVYLPPLP